MQVHFTYDVEIWVEHQRLFRFPVNGQGQRAPDHRLPAATLVSRNVELLSVDRRNEDRHVTRRFAGLCEWLGRNTAQFPTASSRSCG